MYIPLVCRECGESNWPESVNIPLAADNGRRKTCENVAYVTSRDFSSSLRFITFVIKRYSSFQSALLTWRQGLHNTVELLVLERRSWVLWQWIEASRLASARNQPSSASNQLLMLSLENIYTPGNMIYQERPQ